MTTTSPLAQYRNGNTKVMVYSDGTKVRECDGAPAPVHPESIDLKITDWCDGGCAYCHESSTVRGRHATSDAIMAAVSGLPAGVEVAIGGGDPLSHPEIGTILNALSARGLIANVTVNGAHLARHAELIRSLRSDGLIRGLGVSLKQGCLAALGSVADENTIVHLIAGEHRPVDALQVLSVHPKILVLGYKRFGRGIGQWGPLAEGRIGAWRYWIRTILRQGGTVCFDNLALEQLRIKDQIPTEMWQRFYMGGDGAFTMYIDAVRDEFAVSSTSERRPRNGMSAREMFTAVSRQAN